MCAKKYAQVCVQVKYKKVYWIKDICVREKLRYNIIKPEAIHFFSNRNNKNKM